MSIDKTKNVLSACNRKKRTSMFIVILFALSLVFVARSVWAKVLYVRSDVVESGSCIDWAGACRTIEDAVGLAAPGDEIWVKQGTYVPPCPSGSCDYIYVDKAVSIYGGFAGGEILRDQRNWNTNVTIVDGTGNWVGCFYISASANIDGFTITNCSSEGNGAAIGIYSEASSLTNTIANCTFSTNLGGAVEIYSDNPSGGVATVTNCTFSENVSAIALRIHNTQTAISDCTFSGNDGGFSNHGALVIDYSAATVTNCTFSGNTALTSGGAMYIEPSEHATTVSNCTFSGNSTQDGGAIYISGSGYPTDTVSITGSTFSGNNATMGGAICSSDAYVTIANCHFTGNMASGSGEGDFSGGAIYSWASWFSITNSIFSENEAGLNGGAISINQSMGIPVVTNCTFYSNSAYRGGGISADNPQITNCILWANTASLSPQIAGSAGINVTNCDVQGGYTGTGNIYSDPLFVGVDNFHLTATSPCIDVGNNSAPGIPALDFDGNPRIFDGNGDGTATVDMGAYEYQADTTPPVTKATPAGGTYNSTQSVTLTANEPATIYYGIDAAPTIPYAGPINISTTKTLKFFAQDVAGNSEQVKTEGYTINNKYSETLNVPGPTVGPGEPLWVTATFTNKTGAAIQTVRPDCFNTFFSVTPQGSVIPLDPTCRIRAAYGIAPPGTPGSDVITMGAGESVSVECNLSEMYSASVLNAGAGGASKTYNVEAVYSNYIQDPLNRMNLFIGTINSTQVTVTIVGQNYSFYGFSIPVDNPPTLNTAKAGQTIPVKWRLTDANGIPILDHNSFGGLTSVSCPSGTSGSTDVIEEYASGASGLQSLGNGNWQFNWKTPKTYAGQCRVMTLTLSDGTEHIAYFQFK